MLVLYVDDEPALLAMAKLFLEQGGEFSVDTIESAPEALEILDKKSYDAIISDYQMPKMNGIEFLKKIRAAHNTIPFIIFTGRGREEVVIEALNNGADFYLQKGGEPQVLFTELMHKIRQAVMMRRALVTLAEQEQRYHDLQNANDLIQSVAPDGHFLFVNKKWQETLGYWEQELQNLTIFDIIHEESLKHCMEIFSRVISGENVGIIDAVFKTRDGRKVFVEGMTTCKMVEGKPQYTRGLFKDVTERKKTDDALRESEETFRAMVEQSSEGIIIVDLTGIVLFGNQRAADIIENPNAPNTTVRINVFDFVSPEFRPNAIHDFIQVSTGIDRYLVNYKIITQEKKEKWIECIGKKISYKSSPAILLSFRDTTERRKTEVALEESERKFRSIFESSPYPISINGIPDGKFIAVNAAFQQNSGYAEAEILGKNPVEIGLLSSDDFSMLVSRLLSLGKIENVPMALTGKGGIRVHALFSTIPIIINDRPAILNMTVDITQLKKVEEELLHKNEDLNAAYEELTASEEELRQNYSELSKKEQDLRESEERYRALYNDNPFMLFTLDPGGTVISVNKVGATQLGYTTGELEGQSVLKVFYPDDHRAVTEQLQICLKSPGEGFHWQFRKVRKDGGLIWVDEHARAILNSAGELSVLVVCQDITDRKQTENALRKSEKKYRDIIDNMQDIVYRTDREGKLIMISPHGIKLAGYDSEEEMIGLNIALDIYQKPQERERFLAALKERGSVENYPLVLKDRNEMPHLVTASSHFYYDDEGKVLGVEGILHDITELRKKEQDLRESEERYRALYNDNPFMLFTLDPEGKVISVNKVGATQLGYTTGELEGQSVLKVFYPDDHRAVTEQLQICLKSPGEGFHWQFRKVRKDGSLIWVDEHARAILSSAGELSVLVVCQDITDRKTIEDELRLLKVSVDRAADEVFWLDFEGNILYVNDSACQITGYSREEFLAMKIFELDPDFTREIWDKSVADLREQKTQLLTTRHRRKDGVIIDVEIMSVYVNKDDREYSFAFVRDITERKKAEMALRESEERFRMLLQHVPSVAVQGYDMDGTTQYWNDASARLYGYTSEEAVGKNLVDLIIPPEMRDEVRNAIKYMAESRQPIPASELSLMKKDGSRVEVFSSHAVVKRSGGAMELFCIDIDLTERKLAEQRLSEVNSAFLAFCPDPLGNINILTGLAGKLLHGTCALYNRLENGLLCSLGMWNTPPDFAPCDQPEGHICNDVILNCGSTPTIITNLMESSYAETDPNVKRYQLKAYVGMPVKIGKKCFGSLCVVYQDICSPSPQDLEILSFLAKAIAIEDERRTAAQALQESEERFRTILHSMQSGIVIIDAQTHTIIDVNPKALEMIGGTSESVVGSVCHSFMCPAESSKCPVTDLGQTIDSSERVLLTQQGEKISILKSVIKTILRGKEVLIESFVDITERKRAEDALRQANKKLSLLSSITRHDINNQLLSLNGFLEILHRKIPDPAYKDYFTQITKGSNRIAAMIKFTKEYEQIGLHAPIWQDLQTLVNSAGKDATHGHVTLKNDLPANTEVFADPLIVKVFFNLIDNAVRHGKKITTIRFSFKARNGDRIIVCEDDGAGVVTEEKEKIFERGVGKNTGFGLALSREILDITNITIKETGKPGVGARFEITVPKGAYRYTGT